MWGLRRRSWRNINHSISLWMTWSMSHRKFLWGIWGLQEKDNKDPFKLLYYSPCSKYRCPKGNGNSNSQGTVKDIVKVQVIGTSTNNPPLYHFRGSYYSWGIGGSNKFLAKSSSQVGGRSIRVYLLACILFFLLFFLYILLFFPIGSLKRFYIYKNIFWSNGTSFLSICAFSFANVLNICSNIRSLARHMVV